MTPPRRVVLRACAKLNLGLRVGPRRADGFHDLVTVFQSVSLADTLVAERTRAGFSLRVRHEDAAVRRGDSRAEPGAVPTGPENLVLRAARLAAERLGWRGGARFTLTKRIPAQAGMGGGSADAAAALVAVRMLAGAPARLARELAWCGEIGSDVPFARWGGTALGEGRGERLRRLPSLRFRALVAMPRWRVSTREAFVRIDSGRYRLTPWGHARRFASTLSGTNFELERALALGNTFEEVLGPHGDAFDSLCARLSRAGSEEPHLTGSGSAVFARVPDGVRIADVVARFRGPESLFVVRAVGRGLHIH